MFAKFYVSIAHAYIPRPVNIESDDGVRQAWLDAFAESFAEMQDEQRPGDEQQAATNFNAAAGSSPLSEASSKDRGYDDDWSFAIGAGRQQEEDIDGKNENDVGEMAPEDVVAAVADVCVHLLILRFSLRLVRVLCPFRCCFDKYCELLSTPAKPLDISTATLSPCPMPPPTFSQKKKASLRVNPA